MARMIATAGILAALLTATAASAGSPLKGIDVKLGKQTAAAKCAAATQDHPQPCATASAAANPAPIRKAKPAPVPHG
ncbi:MAG: hypothetical protein P0Y56_11510 [Candidatus Andeanibacterium colombiense]|uniref:Uncharacterized protein n=1 Tax=Candidatus Andeanibacterium colombiense TaxID=3121345 RepID=A0AAJ6BNR8_9SPHN|nr:MAG: hypothetical protein P0Y56_11510 [Sphingomonadaceae bacterium]